MANVRAEDVNASMVNLLKKMDTMVEAAKAATDETYMVLSSVEAVMRDNVSTELKKQTSILMNIEAKIGAAAQADASGGNPKAYKQVLGDVATGLEKIIKAASKIDEKAGERLDKFFTKLGEALSKITKEMDEKKAESISKLLTSIGSSVLKFAGTMFLYTLISPFAMVGAVMFGLTIRLLMKSAGVVDEKSAKGMEAIIKLGWATLAFGGAMALYSIIAPLAIIGAVGFGLSVRLLMLTSGAVDEKRVKAMEGVLLLAKGALLFGLAMAFYAVISPLAIIGSTLFGLSVRLVMLTSGAVTQDRIEAMKGVLLLAKGTLLFGLAMAFYVVLAPLAIIGSVLFGLSVRLLLLTAGAVDKDKIEAMKGVLLLAKGAILYSLAMVVVSILSPIVLIGSVLFGLSIRLLLLTTGAVDKTKVEAMKAVLSLAKGALLYSLAMVVVSILSPIVLIGSVLFGLSIRLLLLTAGAVDKNKVEAMKAVLSLAKGALLYSLAMVVVTLLSPIVIIGSVLFGLSIRLLLLSAGTANRQGVRAMKAVLSLAKGILLYTLAMVAVTLLAPIVLIGTIIIGLSLFILSFALKRMGTKAVRKGVFSLILVSVAIALMGLAIMTFAALVKPMDALFVTVTLVVMGLLFTVAGKFFKEIFKGALAFAAVAIAIALIGVSLLVFKAAKMEWMDTAILGAVVVGAAIAFGVAGKFATDIAKGSGAMVIAGLALITISAGLVVFKKSNLTFMDAAVLGATVVGLGIVMGIAGAGPIPGFIAAGSAAMIVAGLALITLSLGLVIFKKSKFTIGDSLALGAAIGVLGVEMALFGLASPLIFIGSAAMAVAAIALLPITGSLAVFKSAKWKTGQDDDALKSALGAILSGFLGGEMPGGILASIKFAAQAAARAALLFVTAPAFLIAGLALIPITSSLLTFKKANFGTKDADNLEYMLGSVVRAFGIVTDYERQKKMGFYVNPFNLMMGIMALSGAGRVLAGLAEGVQAWANLEVNEWEVINPGTKDAKLVIKGRRKLSKSDFENAAYGMATVISAIAKPFADVGKLEMGMASGDSILDAVFGGSYVSKGVAALKNSGDTIVSLAQGVQAFATMEYTEYEVVNAGTSKAKLVPKSRKKISPMDIMMAGINIATIIGVVARAFADVGRWEANSEGWFSGGYVSKGVKALAGVGDNLGAITESVLKMANREIPTHELVGGGTKDAKLVPGKPYKITDADLTKAATTIMDILMIVAGGFYAIGKAEDDSSSWWGDGYITKGVKALAGIGDTIAKITEAVIKIATGEMPTMKEVDGKLVPGAPVKITDAMLKAAGNTINEILMIIGRGVYEFGQFYVEKKDQIDAAVEAIPNMTEALSKLADANKKFAELKDVPVGLTNLSLWSNQLRIEYNLFQGSKTGYEEFVNVTKSFKDGFDTIAESTKPWTTMKDVNLAVTNIKTWSDQFRKEYSLFAIGAPIYMQSIPTILQMKEVSDKLADNNSKWGQLPGAKEGVANFKAFTDQLMFVFDPKYNPNIKMNVDHMSVFTRNIQTMAAPENQLKKVADNFDRIQKSMKLTKDHINAFDLKKLTLTDSLMKSIAAMSKNPEAIAAMVGSTMEKSFQELIDALKELVEAQGAQQQGMLESMLGSMFGGGGTNTGGTGTNTGGTNTGNKPTGQPQPQGKQLTAAEIQSAMKGALSSYFATAVINVNKVD